MRKFALMTLAVAIAFSGATGAFAADTRSAKDRPAWKWESGTIDSKQIIGMRVYDADGKKLGAVDEVILNPKDGKITHAVVGIGGMAGVGEQKVVVPWADLKIARDNAKDKKHMVATIDRAMLDKAPRFVARDRSRAETAPAASPATERTPNNQKKY
jgi:sporulation protein YlmC with PRC-barrel domain